MRDPFALEFRPTSDGIVLYYPLTAAAYGGVVGLVLLGMLSPVIVASPLLRPLWEILLDFTLVGIAGNVVRVIWLSTVCFDLKSDQVRHGLRQVGRVSDVQAIEPGPRERAALQLVFLDGGHQERRWPIPGVR